MHDHADPARPSAFALRALDLAVYPWGSLLPTFTPLSSASAQIFVRNLASLMARVGNWDTAAEFRGWVSLSHELTHYLQDLTTGVGHWDHVVRGKARSPLFNEALRLTGPEVKFPVAHLAASREYRWPPLSEFLTRALALRDKLREELLVMTGDTVPPARMKDLESRAASLLTDRSLAATFRIESLLEGEAVAVVIRQVLRLEGATQEQWQILHDNSDVWHPDQMQPQYGELWFDLVANIQHGFGLDFDTASGRDRDALFELAGTILGLLVDLACAYPSPELLQQAGADRREYEPGLRYLRMLASLANMSEKSFASWAAALTGQDWEQVETLLMDRSVYPYLPSRVVYEDWLTRLRSADDVRWVERLRAESCEIRLENPAAWIEKSPFAMVQAEVPLLVIGPEGISSIMQRWEHLEPEAHKAIYGDLTRHAIVLNLTEYFYESGRYVCPLALAQTCDAATEGCRKGLRYTSELPEHDDCRVREWLQGLGFYLGGGS
jgi:hypothetical protein